MNKYGYKEVRRLSANDLRRVCIEYNWYTAGTIDDYNHLLLDLADRKPNITTDDLVEIVEDIREHSNEKSLDPNLVGDFADMMFIVAQACTSYFEEV